MTPNNHSRLLLDNLVEVLAELAADIERMGATLCCDPYVAGSHLHELQGLDVTAQNIRQVAGILNAPCPDEAMERIQLESLRDRLVASAVSAEKTQVCPIAS